jgi:ribonuclease P protein component
LDDRVARTPEASERSVALVPRIERRLRKHGEFVHAQRTGRRVGTPHFTLLVAAQPPPPRPARLGLVVGRRIGSAVRRNRVKRVCRECFRDLPELLPVGVDLVVIAREGAPELGLAEVRAEWRAVGGLLKKRAAEALARAAGPDHPPATGSPARHRTKQDRQP